MVVASCDGVEEPLAPMDRELQRRHLEFKGLDNTGANGLHRLFVSGRYGAVEIN